MKEGGRAFRAEATAIAKSREDGLVDLRSPAVGLFREGPRSGEVLVGGAVFGELEVLGQRIALRVPKSVRGSVRAGDPRPRAVGYGDVIATVDPSSLGAIENAAPSVARAAESGAVVFRFSSSGRYYARPAPTADPFVSVGAIVSAGQTVALLEVMKTFNRIQYGGAELPERAKVIEILASHDSDVSAGDVLLRLEPAT
jgi:acetyl-CoA carboxylase biotin carboxyl carrier protein